MKLRLFQFENECGAITYVNPKEIAVIKTEFFSGKKRVVVILRDKTKYVTSSKDIIGFVNELERDIITHT